MSVRDGHVETGREGALKGALRRTPWIERRGWWEENPMHIKIAISAFLTTEQAR